MNLQKIRNFSIVAHIDHGKSTLADRILEFTKSVDPREMKAQFLDGMELERERGITIKAKAVNIQYQDYSLNLIDTPGHVDFNYEVSRVLSACEGVLLLVDATQGIQAQTVANTYLALKHDLVIIPVINKIDMASANPERVTDELVNFLGIDRDEIIFSSAKDGRGVEEILNAIIERIPPPTGEVHSPLKALIFDSHYDAYRGVFTYIRVMDGEIKENSKIEMMRTGTQFEVQELGVFKPHFDKREKLSAGEVGYIISGIKNVAEAEVGDTITASDKKADTPLPGYQKIKPMVFCGLYPTRGEDFEALKNALEKLRLNDAALYYEPESSSALGFGVRCGFLGILHLEIIQERLEREYQLNLITTAPTVVYKVNLLHGKSMLLDNPSMLPNPSTIESIEEPYLLVKIFLPSEFLGNMMEFVPEKRGTLKNMEYITPERVILEYEVPFAELITDFYDRLKSISKGYASLDYEPIGYRKSSLTRVDILINHEPVDALATLVHRDKAFYWGKNLVKKLKEVIPKHMFEIPVQAAIGQKVIARETVRALRKDVIQKCYGGDVSRKRKLLERQKEGKKRMKKIGQVDVPQEAFMSVLKINT